MAGGNSILASYFQVPIISYVTEGHKEARKGYFNEGTYYQRISNNNIVPVVDKLENRNYTELLKKVKGIF